MGLHYVGSEKRGKMADGDVVTVCATVSTGLESVAVSECREKLDCKAIREGRGRVYFDIPTYCLSQLKNLRSIENLFVVVKEFEENNDELDCLSPEILEKLYKLPEALDWKVALSLWKQFTGYTGMLFRSEASAEDNIKKTCQSSVDNKSSEVEDVQNSREGGNDKVVDEEEVTGAPAKRIKHGGEDSNQDMREVRNGSENNVL